MIKGELNPAQLKKLRQALKQADLTPDKRKRLLWRIAKRGLIPLAKRHVKNQSAPNGQQWTKRKRGKRKLLTGLPRFLGVRENGDGSISIIFKRGAYKSRQHAGLIGYLNQYGADIQMSAATMQQRPTQTNKPATRGQARALVALGYQIPATPERNAAGRYTRPMGRLKKKRATQGWIREHLNMAQAGLIIRLLKGESPRKTWTISLPERAFLGANDDEFAAILAREMRGIQFGWSIKKQDIKR
ncbi:hypothetical protein GBN32_00290 [Plesiomonas shigelloides]|uniref:hypothetical protein n=1 Tax=Plesiomonas shigelloides TaxID=703 RepID=UPI0012627B90|nr:hypothetical protein [Plesiomonas shigelloides]KAB7715711.1 hypothetical protein GBN32_00290 [Plesiomonas shigelloides]